MGRKATDAKDRILKAAITLFARDGFEKTRVDDIAKRAQVNKALIYYYFDSKDKILEHILESVYRETLEFENAALEKYGADRGVKVGVEGTAEIEGYLRNYIRFLSDRKDVVKILYMESFTSHSPQMMLSYVDRDFIKGIDDLKKKFNIKPKDINLVKLQSFFLGYIPLYMFVIMKDRWCEHYGMDEKEVVDNFVKLFAQEFMVDTFTRLFD